MSHLQKKMKQMQKRASFRKAALDFLVHKNLVTLSSVKCTFFMLFDYAVSISFRTINCPR